MMIEKIFIIFSVATICMMFAMAFNKAMALPDVYFSHSTGDCVKVENFAEGDNYSCEKLPNRYYHVYTE
tara:strand:+ start:196 stop:402 length:207 start_codon:yes stop_codon:yes gene_type:complete